MQKTVPPCDASSGEKRDSLYVLLSQQAMHCILPRTGMMCRDKYAEKPENIGRTMFSVSNAKFWIHISQSATSLCHLHAADCDENAADLSSQLDESVVHTFAILTILTT